MPQVTKIEGQNAIIEGDSFSAIQWGIGEVSLSLEIDILDWRGSPHFFSVAVQFQHILRDANDIADCLAREGAPT